MFANRNFMLKTGQKTVANRVQIEKMIYISVYQIINKMKLDKFGVYLDKFVQIHAT